MIEINVDVVRRIGYNDYDYDYDYYINEARRIKDEDERERIAGSPNQSVASDDACTAQLDAL